MNILSRRQVLLGGLAAGIVGWAGSCARPNRSVAHSVRVPGPAGGELVSGRLDSAHMKHPVDWSLSVPSGQALGTVYCLHGYREDHRFAFETIGLPVVAATLNARVAIAAVDGGDGYWHRRADGTDAMAMLLDDFLPVVEGYTHASKRALLGWSMGGYGALLAAERAPDRFVAVAAASPALWSSASDTAPGAFDDAADYHRNDVATGAERLRPLAVRIDCGTSDPFYQATQRFVALVPGHQGTFGPGGHDAGYWRAIAPGQIATILAAFQSA